MTDIPRLWAIVCDDAGNKLPNIPQLAAKSGRLVLTAMDGFPASQAVFGADERANLALIQPLNTLKFYERGVGLVGWYIIEDPSLLIQDTGDEITLTLPNITDQLTRYSVGTGATYEAAIGDIVAEIGAKGESVAWKTFYDTTGTITGFSAAYPDLIRFYDTKGNLTGTLPGTGKVSGWSAVALDDGPNVLSAAAVTWTTFGTVQAFANNLAKLTSGAAAYDSPVLATNMITAVTDANGNPARADGSFQWQARDVTTQLIAGLGAANATRITDVRYGIEVLPAAAPGTLNATGTWNCWEFGVRVALGLPYSAGDTFAVAVDYSQAAPRIVYYHNGLPVRQGVGTPVLPYRPLAFLFTPGGGIQNAMLTATVKPSRQTYSIAFAQQTPLEALIQVANATGIHVRQQANGLGEPIRALALGNFGTQTNIRLTGRAGGDLARMLENPQVRVVDALTWTQESAQVINTVTPLGASNGDAQVDLERCWSIVNDPGYRNYFLKWGGLTNIFPEYDAVNYPIARTLNRNGDWEYWVRDTAAYNRIGFEIRGKYTDPQFQYVDTVIADQEMTARALYIATVAKLKWESQINDTLDVETVATFRPPPAGSRVRVDFARMGGDVRGNFAVMSTTARTNLSQPYVTRVERTYNNDGSAFDKYTLSFLSRNVIDPSAGGAASLRDLEAIKIVTANQPTYFTVGGESDVDANQNADHSLIVQIRIPQEVFRITAAPLDVQFSPLRQQVTTAANQAQGFTIAVPMTTVTISSPHGTHDLSGTFASNNVDLYVHMYQTDGAGGGAVSAGFLPGPQQYVFNVPSPFASGDIKVSKTTGTTDAQHGHTTQLTKAAVAAQHTTLTGTVDQQQITATLPPHTHPIATNLNDTTTPTLVGLWVDPGTGVWKEISALVVDQLSGQVGPWGASFFLPDLSQYVNYPGQLVRLKLDSRGTANLGVGHLKATGLWRAVIGGGVGQTVFPATAA